MSKKKHKKNNSHKKKTYGKKPKHKKQKNSAPSGGKSYSGGGAYGTNFYDFDGTECGDSDFQVAEPLSMQDD